MYISKKKIVQAYKNEMAKIESYGGETNPQIVELRLRAMGRMEAFQSVIAAMDGQNFLLNTYCKEE